MAKHKQKSKRKLYFLAVALFLPILVVLEFLLSYTPVISSYAQYPVRTVQCGHLPYLKLNFAGDSSYTTPGDANYRGPDIFTHWDDFYCNESEVQKAGARSNDWGEQSCKSVNGEYKCKAAKDGYDIIFGFITILVLVSGVLSYLVSLQIIKHGSKETKKVKNTKLS